MFEVERRWFGFKTECLEVGVMVGNLAAGKGAVFFCEGECVFVNLFGSRFGYWFRQLLGPERSFFEYLVYAFCFFFIGAVSAGFILANRGIDVIEDGKSSIRIHPLANTLFPSSKSSRPFSVATVGSAMKPRTKLMACASVPIVTLLSSRGRASGSFGMERTPSLRVAPRSKASRANWSIELR